MASSEDPDQTAPLRAVCSGSTLFVSILNWSVMLGNYLQQTISADNIFRFIFFLGLKGFSYRSSLFWVHAVCFYTYFVSDTSRAAASIRVLGYSRI